MDPKDGSVGKAFVAKSDKLSLTPEPMLRWPYWKGMGQRTISYQWAN